MDGPKLKRLDTDQSNIRIIVDAMGGDFAPQNIVVGTMDALKETRNRFHVIFVGPESRIRAQLREMALNDKEYEVIDAPEVIEMHDGATSALKQKRNSSISVGMQLHKEGKGEAFVSAGHSGAVMSASTLILGRIDGISRPTIGAFFPSEQGVCLLLDAGANVDCRPQHLYEFGLMGSIYTRQMFNIERPSVGLLNIGEEPTKGNEAAKETHKLFQQSSLNFIGNVEGRDILKGKAHVVVCDGFVGNIILKFGESIPGFFKGQLKRVTGRNLYRNLTSLLMRGTLRAAFKSMDYEEYGGVPVLGVNGVSLIGHGKSTPKAVKNMILAAEEMVQKKINHHIQRALAQGT